MELEPPVRGQVINYPYLWYREHSAGEEEGRKVRPTVVLYTEQYDTRTRVYLLPFTSTPLRIEERANALEIPSPVKQYLRLDASHSWIITDELNHFEWPGVDLPSCHTHDISRGSLPNRMINRLHTMVRQCAHERRVNRDFDAYKFPMELRQSRQRAAAESIDATEIAVAETRERARSIDPQRPLPVTGERSRLYKPNISGSRRDQQLTQPRRNDFDLGG